MKYILIIALSLFGLPLNCMAQSGTAEPGYYPLTYTGETWTGIISSVNDKTREITLTDKEKGKVETFTCILPKGYLARPMKRPLTELKPSDLPLGVRIKVYYFTRTKKMGHKEVKVNTVIRIRGIPDQRKQFLKFMAF